MKIVHIHGVLIPLPILTHFLTRGHVVDFYDLELDCSKFRHSEFVYSGEVH